MVVAAFAAVVLTLSSAVTPLRPRPAPDEARASVRAAQIALEVAVIRRVEPQQRREEPPVGLGQRVADEVTRAGQPRLFM